MSVLVIMKFPGDTAVFRQALTDRAAVFTEITDSSQSQGALHHQFGIGDGIVVVVDEWETAEQFQQFFANPALQSFIAEVGAQGPPEITIVEALTETQF